MTAEPGTTTRVYVVLGTGARPVLVRWSTWWDGPFNYDSYALVTGDGPVAIDPEALTDEANRRLLELIGRPPRAIVLTNDYHERAAYALRERWGAPVWAAAYGAVDRGGELEGQPDHLFEDGDTLPGGLRARKIAGAFAGDTVLVWDAPTERGERVVFTGDTLNGPFNPENPAGPHPRRGAPGLYIGAGPFYLQRFDPQALKASLVPLLSERIDLICGAHGEPWAADTHATLRRLLEAVDWAPFLRVKRHPVAN